MGFFSRLIGTFFDPGRTFAAIVKRPVWLDALIVLLVLLALHSYIIFPYGQKDSLSFLEEKETRLQEKWGEAGYDSAVDRVKNQDRILISLLITPLTFLVGLLFSGLIVLGMGRLVSTQGHYLQVFSSFLYAHFIDKLLGNALRTFLILGRKSVIQTSTSLTVFFPKMEIFSPAYSVLSQVDFFQLWMFGLIGIGLAAAFRIHLKKALFISFTFWLLKSLLMIALTIARLKMLQ